MDQSEGNVSGKGSHGECTLVYPKHKFSPKDYLRFIQHAGFTEDWDALGLDSDDLLIIETMVMTGPREAGVIPLTGGLRELSACREGEGEKWLWVYYVAFEEYGTAVLFMVSDEKVELNATMRRALKKEIEEQEIELKTKPIKFKNVR